ncbi:MAG: TonB-dependent receptor [Gemmatimonas sp.]
MVVGTKYSVLSCALAVAMTTALHAQEPGTVSGRVNSATGQPQSGASVSVTGIARSATAASDGSYVLKLPAGRYEITARAIGYRAAVDSVTIVAGEILKKDFTTGKLNTSLETVAILGSRGQERTVISAPVPVDVISSTELQQSGRTETSQMIQAVAPSFNLPRATVADGSDHIRPATLRGLAPDQALVLVNGKRRHPSALVNLNGFVGRGSQAVDINAIPASMIDHIEILRDGAAAQYGSDAIAGVINIVLKHGAPGEFSFQAGQNFTTYNRDALSNVAFPGQLDERSVHDGETVAGSLNYGLTFGSQGFLQLGGEIRDRAGTNRSLPDTRQQYFTGDIRNAATPAIRFWQGDSYSHDTQLQLNGGSALGHGVELYGDAGYGRRRGASAGMWRRPNDDRTERRLYPDGFLPFIKADIDDESVTLGIKGTLHAWTWDLGTVYGRNAFAFGVDNSANVSVGVASPTTFKAGKLVAGQSTTTLDLFRSVEMPWHGALRVALGGELRGDQYNITAGDSDSYRDGGLKVLDANGVPTATFAVPGAQVFPGFRPTDAGSHSRSNAAGYIDLETDVTSKLLLGAAGRVERYSDFGTTSTGKVATRLQVARGFAIRSAVSSGFRAPSLGQQFFSSTATNFIEGKPFDIRTFPVATPAARLLGSKDLTPERSVNVSAGIALEPASGLAFTADYYHITIDDRIVLTDNFTGPAVQALFLAAGLKGVSGGRYFSNAIDTRSNGVDVVANYALSLNRAGLLRFTSGYNHNEVRVTRVKSTPDELKAFQETLFGRVERARIERGNPRDNLFVSANYNVKGLSTTARTQRYGEVSIAGATPTNATGPLDQTFGAKWVTDVSASYAYRSRYTLTVGADNLLDVYPDRNLNPGNPTSTNGGTSNFGIFPYNGISPFGSNGRFVYTRLKIGL